MLKVSKSLCSTYRFLSPARLGLFLIAIIIFSSFESLNQLPDKYKRVRVGESISLLVPDSFVEMSEEDIGAAFVSTTRPIAAYRSEDRKAQLTVSTSLFEWGEEDIELLKGFYKGAIANSSYQTVKFLNEGEMVKIGNKQGVLFEFIGVMEEDPNAIINRGGRSKYHQVLYSVFNGKILIANFSVMATEYRYWQEPAKKIMTSVRI